jgi:hypothetical protein
MAAGITAGSRICCSEPTPATPSWRAKSPRTPPRSTPSSPIFPSSRPTEWSKSPAAGEQGTGSKTLSTPKKSQDRVGACFLRRNQGCQKLLHHDAKGPRSSGHWSATAISNGFSTGPEKPPNRAWPVRFGRGCGPAACHPTCLPSASCALAAHSPLAQKTTNPIPCPS